MSSPPMRADPAAAWLRNHRRYAAVSAGSARLGARRRRARSTDLSSGLCRCRRWRPGRGWCDRWWDGAAAGRNLRCRNGCRHRHGRHRVVWQRRQVDNAAVGTRSGDKVLVLDRRGRRVHRSAVRRRRRRGCNHGTCHRRTGDADHLGGLLGLLRRRRLPSATPAIGANPRLGGKEVKVGGHDQAGADAANAAHGDDDDPPNDAAWS